jgi:hypothetical protein
MQRGLRTLVIFAFVSAAAGVALGKDKNAPPQIVEYRDVPVQTSDFQDRKTPRDCNGSWALPGQICWKVYPIAWQSFDKQKKGINLLINVWGDNMSGIGEFSFAAVTIAIDGQIVELPPLDWQSGGDYSLYGDTAVIKDESLLRKIATGKEVWFTVHETVRLSIKLSPKTLLSMNAVLEKYDSLESKVSSTSGATGGGAQLEQLNVKIDALTNEYRTASDQSDSFKQQCPDPITNESCLEKARNIIVTGQKIDQSLIPLLNERIAILSTTTQDPNAQKEKDDSLQALDKLKAELASLPEILGNIDQALAEQKRANTKP